MKSYTAKYAPDDRTARASGGRATKGKTNVNVIIATGQHPQPQPNAPMMPPPAPGGIPVPVGGPAAAGPAPSPMPIPVPMPPGSAPMPRKAGGRVYRTFADMDAGALSGMGRLEKTEIAKRAR